MKDEFPMVSCWKFDYLTMRNSKKSGPTRHYSKKDTTTSSKLLSNETSIWFLTPNSR